MTQERNSIAKLEVLSRHDNKLTIYDVQKYHFVEVSTKNFKVHVCNWIVKR